MKDKILNIQAEKWFVRLQSDYISMKAEYDRLELSKKPLTAPQKEALASLRTQWWTTVDSIRTMFMQDTGYIHIPDLSSHSQNSLLIRVV